MVYVYVVSLKKMKTNLIYARGETSVRGIPASVIAIYFTRNLKKIDLKHTHATKSHFSHLFQFTELHSSHTLIPLISDTYTELKDILFDDLLAVDVSASEAVTMTVDSVVWCGIVVPWNKKIQNVPKAGIPPRTLCQKDTKCHIVNDVSRVSDIQMLSLWNGTSMAMNHWQAFLICFFWSWPYSEQAKKLIQPTHWHCVISFQDYCETE